MKFRYAADVITTQLGYIRTLRGHTQQHEEDVDERAFTGNPDQPALECAYWIRVLQARFIAGHYAAANNARSRAERFLWTLSTELAAAEFHFYGALSLAACCPSAAASETEHLDVVHAHHTRLRAWERNCRANFEHRSALVGAEIARIEGRELDAERLYEQAIRSSRANGFIHNEALANEFASRFYAARGFDKIARVYLQDARYGYLRWGADGKVRQLEQLHPHLRDAAVPASPLTTIGAPVERLAGGTVVKASQAVSGEIGLGELIKVLLRIAVEHAGAERGLLSLFPGDEPRIAAEATTGRG